MSARRKIGHRQSGLLNGDPRNSRRSRAETMKAFQTYLVHAATIVTAMALAGCQHKADDAPALRVDRGIDDGGTMPTPHDRMTNDEMHALRRRAWQLFD